MNYKPAKLLGRLANGFESDRGKLVHAVVLKACKRPPCRFNDYGRKVIENDHYETHMGICGAKPGRRSVGWEYDDSLVVNCPNCLKKLNKG